MTRAGRAGRRLAAVGAAAHRPEGVVPSRPARQAAAAETSHLCLPCVKEMPELDRFTRVSPQGWQVVGWRSTADAGT
jgi:hypothetical protein